MFTGNPEKEQFLQRLENDEEFAKLYRFRMKIRDDWQKARQYESVHKEVAGAIRKEKNKKILSHFIISRYQTPNNH